MMNNLLPAQVKIVEVGPRDGLQNEATIIPAQTKIELIRKLSDTGLSHIEATSFVSPKWVPQMADAQEVMSSLDLSAPITYSVLTPNMKGLDLAMESGAKEVAVFGAASEAFSQKNINCSIAESLERYRPVVEHALSSGIPVRGYVSCVLGCPYEGQIKPRQVLEVASRLFDLGCYEVSLGDTIGTGTVASTESLLDTLLNSIRPELLAAHFHNTYGQALANIYIALKAGITTIDSSVAGLGGCPYAKGASGNVATEDVLYMLHGMGIETGVDLNKLITAGQYITDYLGRENRSAVANAITAKQ